MNPSGLKRRVAVSYVLFIAVIAGIIVFNVNNLYGVGRVMDSADWAAALLERVLQVNRLEQSFFLLRAQEDNERLKGLLAEADGMLANHAGEPGVPELSASLRTYGGLWDIYGESPADSDESFLVEEKIREEGKSVLSAAEEMSVKSGKARQTAIGFARNAMIASVAAMLVVAGAFWLALHRKFVRPITRGAYTMVPLLEYIQYKNVAENGLGSSGIAGSGVSEEAVDDLFMMEEEPEMEPSSVLDEDVEFEGVIYNVLTRDLGPEKAQIKTDIFHDGEILLSRVRGYEEVGDSGMSVLNKLSYQHRAIVMGINMGKLKSRLES